jgi:hypothetical protein
MRRVELISAITQRLRRLGVPEEQVERHALRLDKARQLRRKPEPRKTPFRNHVSARWGA